MDVMPGYKQTEVGLIPEDWTVQPLLSLVRIANGQVDPKHEPYCSMILVAPDHVESSTGKLIATKTAAEQRAISGKYIFSAGDIVYGKINPYLRKAVLAKFDGLCSADMYPLKPATDVCSGYILAVILGNRFSKYAESVSMRSGMPKINRKEIAEFSLGVPPVEEQRAIAAALHDIDALLDSIDRLIAKKRDLKQAAIQQLLTGQTRLPGFSGDWEVKSINEIALVGRGRVISHVEISKSPNPTYPVYSSQTYNDGIMGYLSTYDFEGEYVTWTTDGANAGTVFARTGRFNCTNVCGTIKLHKFDHRFIALALSRVSQPHVSRHLGNPKLMNDVMKKIEIRMPKTIEEQNAIAEVLEKIDSEIAWLNRRKSKTVALKQGMMQELLSGRTRLV